MRLIIFKSLSAFLEGPFPLLDMDKTYDSPPSPVLIQDRVRQASSPKQDQDPLKYYNSGGVPIESHGSGQVSRSKTKLHTMKHVLTQVYGFFFWCLPLTPFYVALFHPTY